MKYFVTVKSERRHETVLEAVTNLAGVHKILETFTNLNHSERHYLTGKASFTGKAVTIGDLSDTSLTVEIESKVEDVGESISVAELAQALVNTVEYVGKDTLPALPGWSWYDALKKVSPDHPLLTEHKPVEAME